MSSVEHNSKDILLKQVVDMHNLPPSIHQNFWPQLFQTIQEKIRTIVTEIYQLPDSDTSNLEPFQTRNINIEEYLSRLISQFQSRFKDSPPYTIIRLCELLLLGTRDLKEMYSTNWKFLHAIDVIISVRSTIADYEMAEETTKSTFLFSAGKTSGSNGISTELSTAMTTGDLTNEDITIADATQVSMMDITIEDASQVNLHNTTEEDQESSESGNQPNDNEIFVNEESGSLVLTKIDWLTEEDIAEIESETYLLEDEGFPLHEDNEKLRSDSNVESHKTAGNESAADITVDDDDDEVPLKHNIMEQMNGDILEHEENY